MWKRVQSVRNTVGTAPLVSTFIVFLGSVLIPALEWYVFDSLTGAAVAVGVTLCGWMFRDVIVRVAANYSRMSRTILLAYGACFFVAKRLEVPIETLLAVITTGCVAIFNLNLWPILAASDVEPESEEAEWLIDRQ